MKDQASDSLRGLRLQLLATASALAIAIGASAHAQGYKDEPAPFKPKVVVEIEGADLSAEGNDVVYGARFQNGVGFTNYGLARGDNWAIRGAALYQITPRWSISGGAGSFGSKNTATAPLADGINSFSYPQLGTAPTTANYCAAGAKAACSQIFNTTSGSIDSKVDFIDFDVGYDVGIGTKGTARIFGGVRYAKFEETTRSNQANTSSAFPAAYYYTNQKLSLSRKSSFDGVGPRVGFTADMPLWGPVSIGGTFAVAALFGQVDSTTTGSQTYNPFGFLAAKTVAFSSSAKGRDDVSFNLEAAPALSYSFGTQGVAAKLSVGYRFDQYLGITDTKTKQSVSGVTNDGNINGDAKFNGAFVKLGVGF